MKVFLNSALLIVGVCVLILGSPNQARASDYKNIQSPIFADVKRVFIYVQYISVVDPSDIPKALQRESIEQEVLTVYKNRFSSTSCESILKGKNPYDCNDQPITVVPESEASDFLLRHATSFATAQELGDPGTLNVIVRANITSGLPWFEPPLQSPLFVYYIIQERPGSKIPTSWWITSANAIPLNQNDTKIRDHFLTNLQGSIY